MGMYTKLILFGVDLKPDTPPLVLSTLEKMVQGLPTPLEEPMELPEHGLFLTWRWRFMLCSHSTLSTLEDRHLTVQCYIKNYESEIELFLDWIAPYVWEWGFAGYTQYEESNDPLLVYFGDEWEGGLIRKSVR